MNAETSTYEEQLALRGELIYTNVGTSMMPLLRQNRDLMVIKRRPEGRLNKYDAVLYKRGGKYILHRILKVREKDYVICGDNCRILEYGITDADILGVLRAVVRDGKEISVTDPGYLLYVHLWCDLRHVRFAVIFCRDCLHAVKRKIRRLLEKLGIIR